MFKVAMTEGWLDIMWQGVDAKSSTEMGQKNHNQIWTLYFSFFIFIGTFFLLNLFDGVVINNYNKENDKYLGLSDLTQGQKL